MGGHGSGRWRDYQKHLTVEECIFLDMKTFCQSCKLDGGTSRGTMDWKAPSGETLASASFVLRCEEGLAWHQLDYFVIQEGPAAPVRDMIQLAATPANYRGPRWWFHCPVCSHRARKLYLPAGANHFGCRACHGLTYRCCQESNTLAGTIRKLHTL